MFQENGKLLAGISAALALLAGSIPATWPVQGTAAEPIEVSIERGSSFFGPTDEFNIDIKNTSPQNWGALVFIPL